MYLRIRGKELPRAGVRLWSKHGWQGKLWHLCSLKEASAGWLRALLKMSALTSHKDWTLLAGEEVKRLLPLVKCILNYGATASDTASDHNLWGRRDGSMVRALAALPGDLGSIPTTHSDSQSFFSSSYRLSSGLHGPCTHMADTCRQNNNKNEFLQDQNLKLPAPRC